MQAKSINLFLKQVSDCLTEIENIAIFVLYTRTLSNISQMKIALITVLISRIAVEAVEGSTCSVVVYSVTACPLLARKTKS